MYDKPTAKHIVDGFLEYYNIHDKESAYDELLDLFEDYYRHGYEDGLKDEVLSAGKW